MAKNQVTIDILTRYSGDGAKKARADLKATEAEAARPRKRMTLDDAQDEASRHLRPGSAGRGGGSGPGGGSNSPEWLTAKDVAQQAAKDSGGKPSGGFLTELSSELGKSSMLGKTMKILAGGGAIAAASMVTREMSAFTTKILEMRKGGAGAADYTEAAMSSLPVFGGAFETGRQLRKLTDIDKVYAKLFGIKEHSAEEEEAAIKRQIAEDEDRIKKTQKRIADIQGFREEAEKAQDALAAAQMSLEARAAYGIGVEHRSFEKRAKKFREEYGSEDTGIEQERAALEVQKALADQRARIAAMDEPNMAQRRLRAADLNDKGQSLKAAELLAENAYSQSIADTNGKGGQELERALAAQDEARQARDNAKAARERDEKRRSEALGESITAADAQINASRLRAAGSFYAADLELLQTSYQAKRAELDRQRKEELRTSAAADAVRINAKYDRQGDVLAQQEKDGEKAAARNETRRKQSAADDLRSMELAGIEESGQYSKVQMQKLRIAERFAKEKQHLQEVIDSDTSTPEAKKEAARIMGGLEGQMESAIRRVRGMPAQQYASMQRVNGDAGLYESLAQRTDQLSKQVDPGQKELIDATKRMGDMMRDMFQFMRDHAASPM